MLAHLGGSAAAPDEPAGMVAARIVDILNGGEGGEDLPDVLSLMPLGYWLAEMVRFFGGEPASETTGAAAAQLLSVLRGGDGVAAAALDERYPGDILGDVLDILRGSEPALGPRPSRAAGPPR